MDSFGLTQLSFIIINLFFVVASVLSDTNYCGEVFENQIDHALLGHVISKTVVVDEFECQLKCMGSDSCKSCNIHPRDGYVSRICELNNKTRQMKPRDFQLKKGSNYYGYTRASCMDVPSKRNEQSEKGHCHPGYRGTRCQFRITGLRSQPGNSCKDIRDSGNSRGDGEYWIDTEKTGNPLRVFCDMTTDEGGWLLVSNFVIGNPSFPQVKLETSYHGISGCLENNTFLRKTALEELMTHMPFTQLRFHCSKVRGRTFHVTTAANSSGEAVVQYLSGQTNDEPDSCGSFVRMEDDNSKLAEMCDQWKGGKGEGAPLGKWGEDSLYDHTVFVHFSGHWLLQTGRFECDDFNRGEKFVQLSSGDFWKVFAR